MTVHRYDHAAQIMPPSRRTDSSAATPKVSIRRVTSPFESLIGFPASMHSTSAGSSATSFHGGHPAYFSGESRANLGRIVRANRPNKKKARFD
jgi:hypothetical protein